MMLEELSDLLRCVMGLDDLGNLRIRRHWATDGAEEWLVRFEEFDDDPRGHTGRKSRVRREMRYQRAEDCAAPQQRPLFGHEIAGKPLAKFDDGLAGGNVGHDGVRVE